MIEGWLRYNTPVARKMLMARCSTNNKNTSTKIEKHKSKHDRISDFHRTVKKCQGPRLTNAVGEKLYFAPKNRAILGVWVHESERLPKNYRAQVTGYTFRKGHDNTKPYSVTYHEILEQVELMRNPPARKPPRKKKPRKIPKKHLYVPVPVPVPVSIIVPVPVIMVVPIVPVVAEDPFAALTMLAKVAAQ